MKAGLQCISNQVSKDIKGPTGLGYRMMVVISAGSPHTSTTWRDRIDYLDVLREPSAFTDQSSILAFRVFDTIGAIGLSNVAVFPPICRARTLSAARHRNTDTAYPRMCQWGEDGDTDQWAAVTDGVVAMLAYAAVLISYKNAISAQWLLRGVSTTNQHQPRLLCISCYSEVYCLYWRSIRASFRLCIYRSVQLHAA